MTRLHHRPIKILWIAGAVFALLFIAALIRVGIPTNTDVRLHAWRVDPIDVSSRHIDVEVSDVRPVTVELSTGAHQMQRMEIYSRWLDDSEPHMRLQFSDATTGRSIDDVQGHPVANNGLTTVVVPPHPGARRVRVRITSQDADFYLRGYERQRLGIEVHSSRPAVKDIGFRTFTTVPAPRDRLELAFERTLLRWPAWNGVAIPIALASLLIGTCVAAGFAFALSLSAAGSTRAWLGTILVASATIAPFVAYIMRVR